MPAWAKQLGRERPGFTSDLQADMQGTDHTSRLVAHYDSLAPRYAELYEALSRLSHFYTSRQACLSELLSNVPGYDALEVGCGAGLTVHVFRERGLRYQGVDISPGMIEACRERFTEGNSVRFSVGDARKLAFDDATFDVVACMGVLEYIHEEEGAIKEMARVLRPSGALILSGISKWSPYNTYSRLVYRKLKHWEPACIIHEFHTERDYQTLMSRALLEIDRVVYFDFSLLPPPLDDRFPDVAAALRQPFAGVRTGPRRKLGNGFLMRAFKREPATAHETASPH